MMGVSKPFELVQTIKVLWNDHPLNVGRVYGGTSRDLREAKEWLQVNDFDGDITEIGERFNRFMASEFDGWREQDFPIWGFLKHYGRYAPPRKEVKVNRSRSTYHCVKCDTEHPVSEKCPAKKPSMAVVTDLETRLKMGNAK